MNNFDVLQFVWSQQPMLCFKIYQQLLLVSVAVLCATVIGIPLGILAHRLARLKQWVMGVSAVLWTIPGLALLAFLIPFVGIGFKPAVIALSVYALLPVLRGTIAGLEQVPQSSIHAARGLGFSLSQRLLMVELPLALPSILHAVRNAAIIAMGVATLAAFVGAGGLGDFINRGLATSNVSLIMLGAVPAALLAVIYDICFASCERVLDYRYKTERKKWYQYFGLIMTPILLLAPLTIHLSAKVIGAHQSTPSIVIASKNFSEQWILAELMAQMIEHHSDIAVVRRLNLGTTAVTHQAMLHGDVDLYAEYTGTAWLTVLSKPYQPVSADELYLAVKRGYENAYQITWLPPFGFDNSAALAVLKSTADQHALKTLTDLTRMSPAWRIGAPAEFLSREDAMPRLQAMYAMRFARVLSFDPGLVYLALRQKEVEVIMAFSTDGRIPAYNIQLLEDDKNSFPSYLAAPVIRQAVLEQHPQIRSILSPLFGIIDNETMQQLNAAVDIDKRMAADVAREFLQKNGLI